ncbi:hypothetical protein AGMMS4956_08020 [Bacteroidia bacterium]|nr:hypothetical protein AGMMS4956_08020 [Bacteroidia bacterium]
MGCKSNNNEQRTITPRIQYEFSGGAGRYNYAPSIIEYQHGIRYGFICENQDPFKIVDYVYLYKGIPTDKGYVWQPGTQIIAPSETGWDNCHICDPDVREFKTTYNGETYDWIMTYLGVDQWDCNHNQIGLAISKNIEGPYIKFDKNPLVSYESRTKWGVGQSTTIVLDSATIRLFYSNSNGGFTYRDIQLNDLNNIQLGEEKKITGMGSNNYPAYSQKNVYMVSEQRVEMDNLIPTWVGNVSELTYIPRDWDLSTPGEQWIKIGHVSPKESGFPRNHNPGILTDSKGYMTSDDELIMYFTPAMTGENWLWSYDLYSATFNLKDYFK